MKIENCNLSHLAELMGRDATNDDAEALRVFLTSVGVTDTDDLSDGAWRYALRVALTVGNFHWKRA